MRKSILLVLLLVILICCVSCSSTPQYTVKWYDQNGNLLTTTSVEQNAIPNYNYEPIDTNEYHYEFLGWSVKLDGQILSTLPNATAEMSFYACVRATKKVYTITFDSNGGSSVDSITVEYGSVAVAPQKPHLDEKRFVCWCTDAALTTEVNWATPITGNVTYYAKWADELSLVAKHTISWYDENGNLLNTSSVSDGMTPTYTYTLIDTAEYSYEFLGWSTTKGGQVLTAIPTATSDASYYACVKTTKNKYTITFNSNGGSAVAPITVEYGTVVSVPNSPELKDHTFVCWCTDSSLKNAVNWATPITGNVTYYAKWTESTKPITKYTISWYDENGKLLNTDSVAENTTPSCNYKPTNTAEYSYEFLGWATTRDGQVLSQIPAATQNASYYAKVKATKNKYTITFNSNGGSVVEPITVTYGTVISNVPTTEYEGHKFVSWCTDSALSSAVDWSLPVTANVTYYAKWNITIDIKQYLNALLSGYKLDPYSYLPESMRPTFQSNLIDADDVVDDYSSFVRVSNITSQGFGEQWHMVLDNVQESKNFFNVLSVVETVSSGAVTSFNNYFDETPSETARHTVKNGIYSTTIDYDGTSLFFVVEYTDTIPVFGEQSVQIALSLNIETGEKTSRIQIGDANALRYTVGENSYEFDIKYLGVRRAHFDVSKDADGNVSGHINEFITATDSIETASAADFYVNDKYVVAVGNKADGIKGFNNYIAETYDVTTGKLLGYEVRETKKIVVDITFNTLWFDLCNVSGITSIKQDADENIYINGSSTKWAVKKVGGISAKVDSRRFDIEFRTQYFYTYDAENEKYVEVKASVPMMFVQQENFDTFTADVKSTNNVTLTVATSETTLDAIIEHYTTLVPVFIENKDEVTSAEILEYIGDKITF